MTLTAEPASKVAADRKAKLEQHEQIIAILEGLGFTGKDPVGALELLVQARDEAREQAATLASQVKSALSRPSPETVADLLAPIDDLGVLDLAHGYAIRPAAKLARLLELVNGSASSSSLLAILAADSPVRWSEIERLTMISALALSLALDATKDKP